MSTEPPDAPTAADARHLLARFAAALNSGDGAAVAECVAPTDLQHNPEVPPGSDGLIAWASPSTGTALCLHTRPSAAQLHN
jgi:hypothetical protein